MESVLLPLVIVGLFYFILLRPVLNQQRERKRDISSLDVGDEVLTAGGLFAIVREINMTEDGTMEIILEVAPGIRLRGTTAAVDHVVRRAAELADGAAGAAGADGGEPGAADGGRA